MEKRILATSLFKYPFFLQTRPEKRSSGVSFISLSLLSSFRVDHYVNVTSQNDTALKVALYNNGPIAVDIDAAHESLSFYRFVMLITSNHL